VFCIANRIRKSKTKTRKAKQVTQLAPIAIDRAQHGIGGPRALGPRKPHHQPATRPYDGGVCEKGGTLSPFFSW